MKDLALIRQELDAVDRELVCLFEKRMQLSVQVAEYKTAHGMPVLDASREDQVLDDRAAMADDAQGAEEIRSLYRHIMMLSRGRQEKWMEENAR